MILMTVLIVMFMGIALLLAVYSSFLPFVQNYGNTIQYTTAYYGAISAIERGVLAANLRGPGFDGESGWKWNGSLQNNVGNPADSKISEFYNYGDPDKTSLLWKVNSSTKKIPSPGDGNVAVDFWTGDNSSKNFNTLNYNIAEAIALGNVGAVGAQDYYKASKTPYVTPNTSLTINLRLNPLMKERLGVKQTSNTIKYLSDSLEKLPLVNWTIKGQRRGKPFSIIPSESISANSINVDKDTLVRGGRMKEGAVSLNFGSNQNIFQGNRQNDILNIISSEESDLKNMGYSEILNQTTGTNLTLDLVNLLLGPSVSLQNKGAIYPFLEYQVSVDGGKIADRFFTIQGEGRVGKYSIKMQLKKPTLEQPALGNFTIIF
ncbi:hypothetical protein HXK74_02515 [Candidatus Gracilibacteria bacterium]|nr:hypothetical protein [Candidatus Gracilibacteria bacterium]